MNFEQFKRQRPVGRPRSAAVHSAILTATLELLADEGFDGMSIEAVARRAGVGKTAIYRRWPSKEALVLDALKKLDTDVLVVNQGNFREDAATFLREYVCAHSSISNQQHVELVLKIVGELYERPELFSTLYAQLFEPRNRQLEHLVRQAQARGELRRDLDSSFIMELIAGPIIIHALLSIAHPTHYSLDELTTLTVDAVTSGIGSQSQPSMPESSLGDD